MIETAERILVVVPNWVGDAVMATPALRAIRRRFPNAKITYLMRPYLTELFGGLPWFNEILYWPGPHRPGRSKQTTLRLLKELKQGDFDVAAILTNSFRSALVTSLAKIQRRVGYDREGRGMLLTDKLLADRYNGRYLPVSAVKYYLCLASYLGCDCSDTSLELACDSASEQELDGLFARYNIDKDRPYIVVNPGASFGSAKRWPEQYFARVADAMSEKLDANVLIVCGPREIGMAEEVGRKMQRPAYALTDPVVGLGALKPLIRRSKLLITNDTGPRHFATAFKRPVVTVFGSTDPRWTETLYPNERIVRVDVECGPCMKRTCGEKHHKCMWDLKPQMVIDRAMELMDVTSGVPTA